MYQLCKHGKQDGEPCEECAKICAENKAYWFGQIMAILHGDGGHYLAKYGPEKATKDAINKYNDIKQLLDQKQPICPSWLEDGSCSNTGKSCIDCGHI